MEIKNPKNSNEIEILTALSGCGDIQCNEKWNGARFSYKQNYNTTHMHSEISVSGELVPELDIEQQTSFENISPDTQKFKSDFMFKAPGFEYMPKFSTNGGFTIRYLAD